MSNASTVESGKSVTRRGFKLWQALAVLITLAGIGYAVHLFTRPPDTPLTRAIALIKADKAAAALPELEKESHQHPDNPLVFPWLAQAYLRTDRIAEGRTALDTALRLKLPGNQLAPVVLAYANYYESKGDYAEAERLYLSANQVCNATDLSEGRARLYLGWSEADMAQGQLDDAVRHLELANTVADQVAEPLKSLIPHRLSAAYRQVAALSELRDKDDTKARGLLEKSLLVSDEPATRMALAAICARQGDKDKAIENYQVVAKVDPNNLEARHRLIDLLLDKKDYQHAQDALNDLTDKEKSVENYELLASVDLKLQNYAGAVRAFEDACDLRPKVELLKQLEGVLLEWNSALIAQHKTDQAASIKGHADRVADQISQMLAEKGDKSDNAATAAKSDDPRSPPVALVSSRIWLARGSVTPEGEIKIHNITGAAVNDLSLTAVFYDNTARRATGSVTLPWVQPAVGAVCA